MPALTWNCYTATRAEFWRSAFNRAMPYSLMVQRNFEVFNWLSNFCAPGNRARFLFMISQKARPGGVLLSDTGRIRFSGTTRYSTGSGFWTKAVIPALAPLIRAAVTESLPASRPVYPSRIGNCG